MTSGPDPHPSPIERFGRELARVRNSMGLSQKQLGARLGVSPSLIGHIEIGSRNPKPDLAARCDEIFTSGDIFKRLCRAITAPAAPGWYIEWVHEIEPRAHTLRSWDPMVIPGLLQTANYARAIFRGHRLTSEPEVEEQVQARMQRTLILDVEKPLQLWFLIDEWAMRRPIGGPQVMAEQLDHLIAIAERRNVTIQLVPVDSPCTDGLMSAFTIADLPEAPTTVSVDSAGQAEVSTDPDFVSLIWSRYDSLRTEAFRPGESLIMLKEARQQWSQET